MDDETPEVLTARKQSGRQKEKTKQVGGSERRKL